MADRNLRDIIKFVDASNSITDAEIAEITKQLKFSDVLDLVSAVKSGDTSAAKEILKNYTTSFDFSSSAGNSEEQTQQEAIQPIKPVGSTTSTTGQSAFPKIAPKNSPTLSGSAGTTTLAGTDQQDQQETDLGQLMNDPTKQNDPNVRQIKNLLTRMQK